MAIEVFPELNIFIAVLALLYFAHCKGVVLLAMVSISDLDFFPFQSPIAAQRGR